MTPEDEERGWEEVRARWSDEAVHREWLARFVDLEGLARAGRRYREVLVQEPGDPVAARWRDEILKRATVHGLATLPRTAPPRAVPRWLKGTLIAASSTLFAWALYWLVQQLIAMARQR